MLSCIPKTYKQKDMMSSLFLCAFYTGQRASTCVSVKFKEMAITKNNFNESSINIIFNVTKGKKEHANINRTIESNPSDKTMCIILSLCDLNKRQTL